MTSSSGDCEVLSFVNAPYLPLLDLWLRQSSDYIGSRPRILCTDEAAYNECRNDPRMIAENASDHDWSDRTNFWKSRFSILHQRLESHIDILHTDLDAFWLKSPWPYIEGREEDFIFSREFGLPKHLVPKWGFVLCCGFFRANSTPAARSFFARWHKYVERYGDDQFALNTLLDELDINWEATAFHNFVAHRGFVKIDGHTISFLSLPYACISREPPFLSKGEAVAHTFFEKQYFTGFIRLYERLLDRNQHLDAIILPPSIMTNAPSQMKKRDVATLHMLREFMRDDDCDAALWDQRSVLEARFGNQEAALAAILRATMLAPSESRYKIEATDLLLKAGNTQMAREILETVGTPTADTHGNTMRLRLRQLRLLLSTGLFGQLFLKSLDPAYFGEGLKAIPRALYIRLLKK